MSTSLSTLRIHVDKVKAGYDKEEAVGKTPITEETYCLLGRWFKVLCEKEVKVSIGPDMHLMLTRVKPRASQKEKTTEARGKNPDLTTQCFLSWVAPDWPANERRIFVGLVCGQGGYYLNQDFNPAKLMTGQNAFGPRPEATWMGRKITHTPAGYISLGFNLLGFYLAHAIENVSGKRFNLRDWVDPKDTLWSRIDIVDLLNVKTVHNRNTLLRVLSNVAHLNVCMTRDGEYRELNLKYLFGVEALPVVGSRRTQAPTVSLKRWTTGNRSNNRNGKVAYTLNLYAKDVEMRETGNEERLDRYPEAYRLALKTGVRVEIQLTPDIFNIPEVRRFTESKGWMPKKGVGRVNRVHDTLKVLFPDYDAYVERSCELARFLWQDSCILLVMSPPSLHEIREWADAHGGTLKKVVGAWIGPDTESPRDEALPRARVLFESSKKYGSYTEVTAAFATFEERWKFKMNRVPAITLTLLRQQLIYGLNDSDDQIRIADIQGELMRNATELRRAELARDTTAAKRAFARRRDLRKRHDQLLDTNTNASSLIEEDFKKLARMLHPNDVKTLSIKKG